MRASAYVAQIDMIQGFVESAVQDYEAHIIQRQKEAAEAAQKEEERQRLLAEEEARRKKEEEERMKREKEESEVRERIRMLEKVKEIAEQDPAFLEASSLHVLPARKVLDKPDTSNVEGPKPSEGPKPRQPRQSPTWSTTSSSTAKRKMKFDDDTAPESNVTTCVSKRTKVSHDGDCLLSRAEAVEVVGTVAMELQSIQDALDRTQEVLVHFTSQANGKRRVAIKGSS